jgi:hypothetical protein
VVVVPVTLIHYLIGDVIRSQGQVTTNDVTATAAWATGAAGLVTGLATILIFTVLTGAMTRAVAAEVAGEDPSLEQSYRFGFHRLGSVLVVGILVGLATIAGLIVFILPGIWIGVRLAVAIEALVVENRRGTEAMRRSWELTDGHFWHALGTLLIAAVLTGVVNSLVTLPFGQSGWFMQGLASAVATTVTMPFSALVGVLLYLDLRARKEQLSLETLRAELRASAT